MTGRPLRQVLFETLKILVLAVFFLAGLSRALQTLVGILTR